MKLEQLVEQIMEQSPETPVGKKYLKVKKNELSKESSDEEDSPKGGQSFGAALNELILAVNLAGGNSKRIGNFEEANNYFEATKGKISKEKLKAQANRAHFMAQEVRKWASKKGYGDKIEKVWWVGQDKNLMSKVTNREVDILYNPSDILLDFGDGKFLGVSAKSAETRNYVPLKNLGATTLGSLFDINYSKTIEKEEMKSIKELKLSLNRGKRKLQMKSNPNLYIKAKKRGLEILHLLQRSTIRKFKSFDQESLRKFFIKDFLNADLPDPYYCIITGYGEPGKRFGAFVEDPLNNKVFLGISSGDLTFKESGQSAVGIYADGKEMFKIRFKYADGPLISSIKTSTEKFGTPEPNEEELFGNFSPEEEDNKIKGFFENE